MAARIMSNKVNGKTTVLFVGSGNTTLVIAGNSTVSNVTANSAEIVSSALIRQVVWGTTNANGIQIYRGANLVMGLAQAGHYNLAGVAQNLDASANITVALPDGNSTVILELGKNFSAMSNVGGY